MRARIFGQPTIKEIGVPRASNGASSTMVVQDGTTLFWGDTQQGGQGGAVYAKPLVGGPQILLASAAEPLGIAFDATHLYVTTGQGGEVLKVPKAGGAVTRLASNQGWPYGIAVDDKFVYWVHNDGGPHGVMRIAK